MADKETGGALTAVANEPASVGGRDIAQNLAYGSGQGGGYGAFATALGALMDPERSESTERKAFWAGATGPQSGGMSGVSNAMSAQVAAREAQDKLRAAYIPLIMQSMVQQRQTDLGYAQFGQQRAEKVTPMINQALYGMQADGKTPSLSEAHKRIDDVGSMFNMAPQELLPHHLALHRGAGPDGSGIDTYLQQLRVAAAPPAEGLSKFGTNQAGQTTLQNQVKGQVGLPGEAGMDKTNPTKTSVEMDKMYRGNPGKYTEDMAGSLNGYADMLNRGNAINDALASFTPGKYSAKVGGLAAATKDLARMFPGATTESINNYVTSLMGPKGDGTGANPVAAQQFAESMKVQEAMAQLKTSLDGQGRIGQQELMMLNGAMMSTASDPASFDKFMTYAKGRAANVTNKLQAWGEYASKNGDNLSVPAFEIPYSVEEAKQLIKGGSGQLNSHEPNPAVPNKTVPPVSAITKQPTPPTQGMALPSAAPAQKAAVRLEDYEPGAKVGPTGTVYVLDKGLPRPARPRGVQGNIN